MKTTIIKFLTILSLALLSTCKNRGLEVEPLASGQYSSQVIDSLLYAFESGKDHDTKPNHLLFQAFIRDFPDAKDIDWEISNFIYRVEFEINDRDYKAFYDQEANLIAYRYEISENELPAVVKNASVAIYPDYNFDEIEKIVKGKEIFYQIEIEKKKDEKILILRYDGIIVTDSTKYD